jgi:hypothetical protein
LAGLLIGYLVSEVFRRAADATEATMRPGLPILGDTYLCFSSCLMVPLCNLQHIIAQESQTLPMPDRTRVLTSGKPEGINLPIVDPMNCMLVYIDGIGSLRFESFILVKRENSHVKSYRTHDQDRCHNPG